MPAQPMLGQIMMVGFTFPPLGWAFCNGQLLSIDQNTALYSLLGTTYGGDGITTFALPDLRGRFPIHQGQGAGLSSYVIGQVGGTETVTLITTQLPVHSHPPVANSNGGGQGTPTGAVWAAASQSVYSSATPAQVMNAATSPPAGGSQPHDNMSPYLVVNFAIALEGIFPSRN